MMSSKRGRPQSGAFKNGFSLQKTVIDGHVKYSALCLICKLEFKNTAEVRLNEHRAICKTPSQSSKTCEALETNSNSTNRMNPRGRRQNKAFNNGFSLQKTIIDGRAKYSALCLSCKRVFKNTGEVRLNKHRAICEMPSETLNDVETVSTSKTIITSRGSQNVAIKKGLSIKKSVIEGCAKYRPICLNYKREFGKIREVRLSKHWKICGPDETALTPEVIFLENIRRETTGSVAISVNTNKTVNDFYKNSNNIEIEYEDQKTNHPHGPQDKD